MHRQRFLALALVAAGFMAYTAPAVAQAGEQPPARAGADSGRRMFDPVGRLLAQRSELKLTDEQAKRLEAIRAKYPRAERGEGGRSSAATARRAGPCAPVWTAPAPK